MILKRKPQSNFICDPDVPSSVVTDTILHDEHAVTRLKIIDYPLDYIGGDKEIIDKIQKLKRNFIHFKESLN